MPADLPSKQCPTCGRDFAWRKKWARCWESVRYCSDRCRRRKNAAGDRRLEDAILDLLQQREPTSSICPSEVARREHPDDWRQWMPAVRDAARRLAAVGRIEVTQRGQVVDAKTARGAIRLRLAR